MKKIFTLVLVLLLLSSMIISVSASNTENQYNNTQYSKKINIKAEREYNGDMSLLGLFTDYTVYSDGDWIYEGNIGVGAIGWTNIVEDDDGTYRYHYTNVCVYPNDNDQSRYIASGRVWGYGKVWASTGNVGLGSLSDYRIFYGWN